MSNARPNGSRYNHHHRPTERESSLQFTSPAEIAQIKLASLLDADWFCTNILNSPNDPWQSEVFAAAADAWKFILNTNPRWRALIQLPEGVNLPLAINPEGKNKITIRAPHNPGKTHFAAKLMHWFNFVFHGRIVCTAPKQQQLTTRLWPEFYKVLMGSLKEYQLGIDWKKTSITWNGDETWYAVAETGSKPENLAGHHDEYMLVIVDEASGVNEMMYPQIEAAQAGGVFVLLLLIGNPTRTQGTFWASHKNPRVSKNYFTYHVTLDKAPRVSRKWVQEQIDKYGAGSPVVKVRCFGEFADIEADQLIALDWVENAKGRELPKGYETLKFRTRITGDIADGGVDECVFTIARIYEDFVLVVRQIRKSWESAVTTMEAAKFMKELWIEYHCNAGRGDDMVVDSIGVGAGTAGHLIVTDQMPVVQYKGGESSDDETQWRNRRCQSYLVGRNALRDGWLYIDEKIFEDDEMDWEDFMAQLCSIRRKAGTERVEDLETKAELLKRIAKSPDMADSWAMLFATQRPTLGSQPGEAVLARAPSLATRTMDSVTMDYGDGAISVNVGGGKAASLDWG